MGDKEDIPEWQRGLRAFRQGRLREAADRLKGAAHEHEYAVSQEARFQTLCHLGAAQYALGRPEEAAVTFEDAYRLVPMSVAVVGLLINLANAYLASGRPDAGRRALHKALVVAPGTLEAQVLLRRLDRVAATAPSGAMLGEDAGSVSRYLQTLSFSRRRDGGFEPEQVQLALAQIQRYVELLASQVIARGETITRLEAELTQAGRRPQPPEAAALTPLEVLFQQKP